MPCNDDDGDHLCRGAPVATLKAANFPAGSSQTITLPLASTSRTNYLRVVMDCEWCGGVLRGGGTGAGKGWGRHGDFIGPRQEGWVVEGGERRGGGPALHVGSVAFHLHGCNESVACEIGSV
jgi:hypothetical protein